MPSLRILFTLTSLLLASVASAAGIEVNASRGEFTLVLLPDTQRYSRLHPAIFLSQTNWIKQQRDALNIRFVLHLGDITDKRNDREWRVADEAMSVLDDWVPYIVVPGNHDIEEADPTSKYRLIKLAPRYNAVFTPRRFKDKPWYGGHKGITNDNNYVYFNAGGRDYMILGLEFGPTDEVLEWANQIVTANADRRVIVVTHSYMYSDDTRVGEGDDGSPHKHHPEWNDGEEMWEKFVRRHENIFMVVSGHITAGTAGRLSSIGDHGNVVHQMLSNYQMLENGGNGWLRILKFVPGQKKLIVRTWSPWLGRFDDDPKQSFELDITEVPDGGYNKKEIAAQEAAREAAQGKKK